MDRNQILMKSLAAPAGFPGTLRTFVAEKRARAAEAFGPGLGTAQRGRLAAMGAFENYLFSCDEYDRNMVTLHLVNDAFAALEKRPPSPYVPSRGQEEVLTLMGAESPAPTPKSSLEEMAAAGVQDLINAFRGRLSELLADDENVERWRGEAAAAAIREQQNENEMERRGEEIDNLLAARARDEQTITELRAYLRGDESEQEKRKPTKAKSKTKNGAAVNA